MFSRSIQHLTLLLLTACCGCNVVGLAANAMGGGSTTPATFKMAKRPTVVVAENFTNPANAVLAGESLARSVTIDLSAHQVAPMIDPERIDEKRREDPSRWRGLTIAAVGRAVDAEQILYLDIVRADVERADAADLIRGVGEVHVKLIDAKTGGTIWPTDAAAGMDIAIETPFRRVSETDVRAELVHSLALRISSLFYSIKQD